MLLALNYHRIRRVEAGGDFWGLTVSPTNFASHLEVLSGEFEIAHDSSTLLPTMAQTDGVRVLVTFDDGYADNLYEAVPLLERYKIPAIVFLASGYIGQPHFWWDMVETIFRYPTAIGVSMDGERLQATWESLLDYRPAQRTLVLKELLHFAGNQQVDSNCRPLTKAEVLELASCSLMSFGGHTRSHPWLPHLSPEQMLEEIKGGRRDIEALTARDQIAFAYPFGAMDENAKRAAAEAGFSVAFTTVPPCPSDLTYDPLAHPRMTVADFPQAEFRTRLRRFTDARHSAAF
jgi:peptidoglycan/xylan/chitin deacetylase (PgdA/CDA1 family)